MQYQPLYEWVSGIFRLSYKPAINFDPCFFKSKYIPINCIPTDWAYHIFSVENFTLLFSVFILKRHLYICRRKLSVLCFVYANGLVMWFISLLSSSLPTCVRWWNRVNVTWMPHFALFIARTPKSCWLVKCLSDCIIAIHLTNWK